VDVDLASILLPETSPLEIALRGTLTYLALLLLLRVALKRQSGGLGVTDILVLVLIADAAQNAMADDYRTIADGLLLVATILFWAFAIDWLGYRIPVVERLVHPAPLPLIEDGQPLLRNLRAELLTHEELMSHLRAQGVDHVSEVERAYLEGNGQLTVIKRGEGVASRRAERGE
jgi:uncharacterized membrane protein YcaP (DUF421 family)